MSQFLSNLAFLKHFSFTEKAPVRLLILFLLACVFTISDTYAQVLQTYNTAGPTTWVCPAGVNYVTVQCWGGGGGGGSSAGLTANGGTGGGGGAFSESVLSVTPGNTYYITVGNGGAATSTATVAGIGGDSWFNTANSAPVSVAGVLAKGGGRGVNNSLLAPTNRGLASGGFGNITRNGGNGRVATANLGGGGGSSAGYLLAGVNATGTAGATAPAGGGNGGNSTTTSPSGSGLQPGGGGGGSDDVNGFVSGAGGVGRVILGLIYCTPAPSSVDGSGITNVTFGSGTVVNNTTGAEAGNYGNYSAQVGNGTQGATLNVSITYQTGLTYDTKIWVDWNGDLVFTDASPEMVYSGTSTATNPTTLAASFVIPGSTPAGNYRMRIGGRDVGAPTPCYTGTWGAYEDYTLNVIVAACPAPTIGTITQPACPVTTGSVQLTGLPSSGTWTVTRSPGAVTTTGTGTSTTISGLAAGTYTFTVTDASACTSPSSADAIINACPPPNDACADAIALPCGTSNLAGTTVAAVLEISPNSVCTGGYGVWYKFTGDGNSTTISSVATFDHGMAIFSASGACSGLTSVQCVDNTSLSTETATAFTAVNGTQYYVYVAHWNGSTTGTFTISRTCVAPPADPCASVTAISACGSGNAQTYTGGGAGSWNTSTNNSCGFTTPGVEQIYSFVPATTGTYSIQVTAASGYVDYQWKASTCSSTGWTCIDDITTTGAYGSMSWTAGTTYYILLDDEDATTGTHTFYINCPAADPCASVTAMTCGTTYNTSMSGSSSAWSLTSCWFSGTPGQERVFSFTPATTGNYRLDVPALTGGYIDFFYRSGSCSGPSGWTCLGDLNGPGYTDLDLIGGTTYHFLLDPEGTGSYTASLNFICAPSNDACANATTLTLDAAPVTGNIASANLGSGACSGYDDYDVWYKFTTQCTGNYVVTVDPGFDFDAVFQVYEGSCSGTQVVPTAGSDLGDACIDGPFDNGNEFGTFNLQAGTTYFVRVYDFQDLFDFDIPEGSSFVIDVNNNASAINSGFATWTGNATDRLWQNSVNWDCGVVPTATTRVIIPAQVAVNRQPQINNGISADVLDIEIQGSTVDLLEVLNGGDLEVHTP